MRKQDIKYLNIEKLFDKKHFSRIKLTALMFLGNTENASGYDCLTQLI